MTTSARPRRRATAWAVAGVIFGGSLIALEVRQGAPLDRAIQGAAILIGIVAAVWFFQTRSETASALAGKPVDERWQLINERALVVAAAAGLIVAVGGFALLEAMGQENWQFALMTVVLSGGYLVGVAWYRWRL